MKNSNAYKYYVNLHKDDQLYLQTTHAQYNCCKVQYTMDCCNVDRASYQRTAEVIRHYKYEKVYYCHTQLTSNKIIYKKQ